jgi:hypothetical protein
MRFKITIWQFKEIFCDSIKWLKSKSKHMPRPKPRLRLKFRPEYKLTLK